MEVAPVSAATLSNDAMLTSCRGREVRGGPVWAWRLGSQGYTFGCSLVDDHAQWDGGQRRPWATSDCGGLIGHAVSPPSSQIECTTLNDACTMPDLASPARADWGWSALRLHPTAGTGVCSVWSRASTVIGGRSDLGTEVCCVTGDEAAPGRSEATSFSRCAHVATLPARHLHGAQDGN